VTSGLRLECVSHAYAGGPDVVEQISLKVPAGAVGCLAGPSGCGKTTLLRLAAGLEVLTRGRIVIGGRTVADGASRLHLPPEARRTGLMFQDYALFPHLTVFDNVAFGIRSRPERRKWVPAALERVGLADLADSYPHTLSGGEQQRCALLRALAPEPDVLLLDEPFSGLDVTRRAQVRERTLELLRESGVATLIVTHDPEEAMFMADRLFVMNDGRIVQQGTPANIYLQPADAFVAALFGPLNRIAANVAGGRVETPIGTFEAAGVRDGTGVELLVRPEGLQIDGIADGVSASVQFARLLGRSSHLRLRVDGIEEPLQALVPGVFLPEAGSTVRTRVDPKLAFVFPRPSS
jgi:iron(III) transport system ATP-binding protein